MVESASVMAGRCPFGLRIYPRGDRSTTAKKAVSAFISVRARDDWLDKWTIPQVQLTLEAKNVASEHSISLSFSQDFSSTNPDWGWNAIVECDGYRELKTAGWIFPDDTLRFTVQVLGRSLWDITWKREEEDMVDTMWKAMKFTDMCLCGGEEGAEQGVELPCHRAVLAASSPVFDRMLTSGMREGLEQRLVIRNASASTLRAFLKYIYMKKLPDIALADCKTLQGLIQLADQYDMQELFSVCANRLVEIARPANICDVIKVLGAFPDHPTGKSLLAKVRRRVKSDDTLFDVLWQQVLPADQ
eukprot:UN0799